MENSFYYFFSATPQVLGSILALFGVFVIFKIQVISERLLSLAHELKDAVRIGHASTEDIRVIELKEYIRKGIINCNSEKNLRGIRKVLNSDINNITSQSEHFLLHRKQFLYIYEYQQKLIGYTIKSSIFNAVIIILCLGLIPLGKTILCYPFLLYSVFSIIVICISLSLFALIFILSKSLKSDGKEDV